jgi:hypothetical protein
MSGKNPKDIFADKQKALYSPNADSFALGIYKTQRQNKIGCFKCLNLKYKKQRYKGMPEATTKIP